MNTLPRLLAHRCLRSIGWQGQLPVDPRPLAIRYGLAIGKFPARTPEERMAYAEAIGRILLLGNARVPVVPGVQAARFARYLLMPEEAFPRGVEDDASIRHIARLFAVPASAVRLHMHELES